MSTNQWVPLHERERLSIPHMLAISANQLAACLIWTPIGLLINPMCTIFKISNVFTTLIILVGPISGLIVPPIVAAYSDKTTLKWGRRRIWMVIGEVLALLGLMFLAFCDKIGSSNGVHVTFLVLGQIIASVGGNIFNGPGRTMCTDLTPDSQQVMMSNFCQIHNGLAGVISNLIGALKLYEYAGMQNAQFVLLISCLVGCAALILSIVVSHEEPITEPPKETGTQNPFLLVLQGFKLYSLPLWLVVAGFFLFNLGANQYNTQIANFMGMNVFGGDPTADEDTEAYKIYDSGVSHTQLLALIQTIIQVGFSFASTYFTNIVGLPGTWAFGLTCGAVAQVLFFFIMNKWVYVIASILWSFNQVIGNGVPYSVISLYGNKENMGAMLTVCIFAGNVAGFLANFMLTMGLGSVEWFKSNPGRLIGVPVVFTILGDIIGVYGIILCQKTLSSSELDNDDEKEDVDDADLKDEL